MKGGDNMRVNIACCDDEKEQIQYYKKLFLFSFFLLHRIFFIQFSQLPEYSLFHASPWQAIPIEGGSPISEPVARDIVMYFFDTPISILHTGAIPVWQHMQPECGKRYFSVTEKSCILQTFHR